MTYTDKGERHEVGSLNKFGHLTFWVGNAKQAAEWYCTKFGFQPYFYKGTIFIYIFKTFSKFMHR